MWSRLWMSLRLAYKRPATMGFGHYHVDDPLKPEEACVVNLAGLSFRRRMSIGLGSRDKCQTE
jgi:hypothetical protein